MRSLLACLATLAVGCTADLPTLDLDNPQPPDWDAFELPTEGQHPGVVGLTIAVSYLIPGETGYIDIWGGDPLERAHVVYSLGGVGTGDAISALGNQNLGVLAPYARLGSERLDSLGFGIYAFTVPSGGDGIEVCWQSAIIRNPGTDSPLSNVECTTVGVDTDGNGVPDIYDEPEVEEITCIGTSEVASSEGECTVESCSTYIDPLAPEFYHRYFRCVDVTYDATNGDVSIWTDGLAPHPSWYYDDASHPNYTPFVSQGSGYYQNPGDIDVQDFTIIIPENPTSSGLTIDGSLVDGDVGSSDYEYTMGSAGVAIDGVSLFNPLAAPGDDIADEVFSFDYYEGHPAGTTYHYHTTSPGPLEVLEHMGISQNPVPGAGDIEVYGIFCDGTIVLGCSELDGSTPSSGDFDSQNGHLHDMTDELGTTHFTNRYHTHVCPGTYTGHLYTPEIGYYSESNCPSLGGGPP